MTAIAPQNIFLLFLLGTVILFAIGVMCFIQWQARQQRALRDADPDMLLRGHLGKGFRLDDALIASLQTSSTQAELILRHHTGQDAGTVVYDGGIIWMTVEDRRYDITHVKRPYLEATYSNREGQLIRYTAVNRYTFSPSNYDVPHVGRVTVAANLRAMLTSDYPILQNGKLIGRWFATIRNPTSRHLVLLLPDTVPLETRAFIMAMEYRRLH